jgi:hypothetical protein
MLLPLKRFALKVANGRHVHLTRHPSGEQLRDVLRIIKPFDIGVPLVRIGAEADGGYLVPDDMEGVECCFSPGVSTMADFELALARRGVRSYLADASVDGPPVAHPLFDFEKKFLGRHDEGNVMTLETWVNSKPVSGDMILQMDIEGAENDVLFAAPPSLLRRFRIIVIEFHELERLRSPDYLAYFRLLLEKLAQDFVVCHLHPNNWFQPVTIRGIEFPRLLEATFVRRDRARSLAPRSDFPHALDRANIPDRPDFALSRDWFA